MAAMGVVPDTVRFIARSSRPPDRVLGYRPGTRIDYRATRHNRGGWRNKGCNEWLSTARNAEDRGQQFVHGGNQRDLRPFPCASQPQIISTQPWIDANGG